MGKRLTKEDRIKVNDTWYYPENVMREQIEKITVVYEEEIVKLRDKLQGKYGKGTYLLILTSEQYELLQDITKISCDVSEETREELEIKKRWFEKNQVDSL